MFVLSAVLAASAAWGAAGAARATSPAYDQCMTRAAGVTSAMRDCASAESARQDAELNAVYRAARGRLDGAGRDRLRLQERGWLKRRTAECGRRMAVEGGGTAALLVADSCVLELTDRRIAELKAIR